MKKFMTVLLVIAVMFTFSFGSAFADVTNTEANAIMQATDYAKAQLPEAVQKAIELTVKNGANAYITKEAWDAAAADIVADLEDEMEGKEAKYLDGTTALPTNWDKYDVAYAANALYGNAGYDYISLASFFAGDNWMSVAAAKEQFKLDLAKAVAKYDKIDADALYSKTTPKTGATYYEQAVKAIKDSKEALNDYYLPAGKVNAYFDTVAKLQTGSAEIASVVANGADFFGNKVTGIADVKYEGTSVVKYYYLKGITMMEQEAADDAADVAAKAALKAAVAQDYANLLKNEPATDKTDAAKAVEMLNFLIDEEVCTTVAPGYVKQWMNAPYFEDNMEAIEDLEATAAKYAAEKDADGNLLRDAEDIEDIIVAAKKVAYGNVFAKYDNTAAKGEIAALSLDMAAAKLAFDKEAEKADLADELDSIIDGYYDLEAAAVKAEYEKAYAAVDAAKKVDEFATIETALDKAVAKIAKKATVEGKFTSGAMKTELDKQVAAAKAYLQYANAGVKAYADDHIEYSEAYLTTQVRDYYIANNARTADEMKALTGVVEAVVAGLPTNADLAAAEKAADDAIKALPAASKVSSADKDAFQNAFDLAKAYNKMVKAATGVAGTKAIAADKVDALKAAIQEDIQLAYAKADKTDKAAMKAIAADVAALNKEVGAAKLFTTKFVDPTVDALAKIAAADEAAVRKAIAAIPFNVTEADKAAVEAARALYEAYVAEYTDYDLGKAQNDAGFVADDFALTTLVRAEAALGLNVPDAAYSVEGLKITASSKATKGAITVKWTVKGDTSAVEGYEIWKSTKKNSGFKKAFTATKMSYKNTKGLKKGTRYFYKVRAIAYTEDGVKVTSDWSNKAYRVAK